MFLDPEAKRLHEEIVRQHETSISDHIGRVLWFLLVATLGFVAVFVVMYSANASTMKRHGAPRYYKTPMGTTCADVKQKQREYGFTSVAQARAFASANGILVTPTQERQILSCLRNSG